MAKKCGWLLLLLPALACAGNGASGSAGAIPRQPVIQLLTSACLAKAGQEPLLKSLLSSPAAASAYCGCAGERIVSGLSDDELLDAVSKGKGVAQDPVWKRRLLNVGLQCLDQLVK